MEGLIISSDLKDNDKTHNKNTKKSLCQTNLPHLHQLLFLLLITLRTSNVNTPDIDAIHRYVSRIVATNVGRDFIETIAMKLVNKNIIFNKQTAPQIKSMLIILKKVT